MSEQSGTRRPGPPQQRGARPVRDAAGARGLATEEPAGRSTAWWGMVLFVATEATLVASLLGTYFYLRFQFGEPWPPGGVARPELLHPLIMTGLLLASGVPLLWAQAGGRRDRWGRLPVALGAAALLTAGFLVVQGIEYADQLDRFTLTSHAYGSLFYGVTGLHAVHVCVGLLLLFWLLAAVARDRTGAGRRERIRLAVVYWYFLEVVWLGVLFTVYLSPRL
ncbi:heme-copper oxidase subunit III [Micromonospora sp. NPDC049559]|uniref:cytochrome c oxidase subunit 3 n=1 Tax=Micromonospora sp. NPDC049559 TaxID=3155923 RepID=UPI00342771C7